MQARAMIMAVGMLMVMMGVPFLMGMGMIVWMGVWVARVGHTPNIPYGLSQKPGGKWGGIQLGAGGFAGGCASGAPILVAEAEEVSWTAAETLTRYWVMARC